MRLSFRNETRGIALVTALFTTLLVMIMILSFLVTVRTESQFSKNYQGEVKAHYAAEAGLAACQDALRDRTWTTGFQGQSLASGTTDANYTVNFTADASGPVGPEESVNNLLGVTPVNGPRGAGTVPPGGAHLIIVGRSGLSSQTLEVTLRNGAFSPIGQPVLADNQIRFSGDVQIDGIDNLRHANSVNAEVHSNAENPNNVIEWDQSGVAEFGGTVSVSGDISSIDLSGAILNGNPQLEGNTVPRKFPEIDVTREVQSRTTATRLQVTPGQDLVVGTGHPEDFRINGNTIVNGDLVLDGGTLFVDGNLTVEGSIVGEGGVYINGETHFYGGAELTTGNERKVAVFSQGNLHLEGYDGSQYLQDRAGTADPILDALLTRANDAITGLKDFTDPTSPNYDLREADKVRASLGERFFVGSQSEQADPLHVPSAGSHWSPHGHDLFNHLAEHLDTNYPADPARDYLIDRFHELEYMFHNKDIDVDRLGAPTTDWQTYSIGDWRNRDTFVGGPYDRFIDRASAGTATAEDHADFQEVNNVVRLLDPDELGKAYFQGLVYSRGDLVVDKEIHVLGGVMSQRGQNGNGSMEYRASTKVTFVEEYFDSSQANFTAGRPTVVSRLVK